MSLYDKYYDYVLHKKPKTTKAEEIVFDIMRDFTDRRGLRQEWEQIDDDIKEEIIEKWITLVNKKL